MPPMPRTVKKTGAAVNPPVVNAAANDMYLPEPPAIQMVTLCGIATDIRQELNFAPGEKRTLIILDHLEYALSFITDQPSIDWDPCLGELVEAVKMCLILPEYYSNNISKEFELQRIHNQEVERKVELYGPYAAINDPFWDVWGAVDEILKTALKIIEKLCQVFSDKSIANYFLMLMAKTSHSVYPFLDIISRTDIRSEVLRFDPGFTSILNTIETLCLRSKTLILMAVEPKFASTHPTPFTSLGSEVAKYVADITHLVLYILGPAELKPPEDDFSAINLEAIYKLLFTVTEQAPYCRSNTSVFEALFSFAMDQVKRKPANVPRPLLAKVLAILVGVDMSVLRIDPEFVSEAIGKDNIAAKMLLNQSLNYSTYWILNACGNYESIEIFKRSAFARQELQILNGLAKNHYTAIKCLALEALELAAHVIEAGLSLEVRVAEKSRQLPTMLTLDQEKIVFKSLTEPVYWAIMLIKTLLIQVQGEYSDGRSRHGHLSDAFGLHDNPDFSEDEIQEESVEASEYQKQFANIFKEFLSQTPALLTSQVDSIPLAVVECVSTIDEGTYNAMDDSHQRLLVVSIINYAQDSRIAVRTMGGRCIAHFLEFQDIAKNCHMFLLDAFDLIEMNIIYKTKKSNLATSNYAAFAWAMGNLANSLAKYCPGIAPCEVGYKFLQRMYRIAGLLTESGNRSRYNGYRALGGILRWVPEELMGSDSFNSMVENCVMIFGKRVAKGPDFKSRWNACYGLGCILQNKALVESLRPDVIETIRTLLTYGFKRSENFKEKSNCVKALCFLTERSQFGDLKRFHINLQKLLDALDAPDGKVPCDYKLVNKLGEDIGFCVIHMLSLATNDDMKELESLISENMEKISRCVERTTSDPERAWIVLKAEKNILQLTYTSVEANNLGTPWMLRKAFNLSVQPCEQ